MVLLWGKSGWFLSELVDRFGGREFCSLYDSHAETASMGKWMEQHRLTSFSLRIEAEVDLRTGLEGEDESFQRK